MRIGQNREETITISFAVPQNQSGAGRQGNAAGSGKAVQLCGAAGQQSPVWQKKELAKKQARKMIADAFESDSKVDQTLEETRGRIRELKAENVRESEKLREAEAQMAAWKEEYHVEDDSQEQQDLELLKKRQSSEREGSGVVLTAEDRQRLAEIDKRGLTEYQSRCLEVNRDADSARGIIELNKMRISAMNRAIGDTKVDMLKQRTMGKAQDDAEALLQAASGEAVSGLIREAKEHIDEKLEEEKEKAEERKEKKEEEEEKIENRKEQAAEQEARIESQRAEISAQEKETEQRREKIRRQREEAQTGEARSHEFVELESERSTIQEDAEQLLKKLGLLDEDIKGLSVDELL